MDEQITPQEQEELKQLLGAAAVPDEKHNTHSFLTKVVEEDDTTKVGNLEIEEIGEPKLPQRTLKELALFSKEIANMPEFAEYFNKEAEILTSTSLSKEGFLTKLATITTRQVADITQQPKKKNKGWFKKKK